MVCLPCMGKCVGRKSTSKEESPCRRYMQLALHLEPVADTHVFVAGLATIEHHVDHAEVHSSWLVATFSLP